MVGGFTLGVFTLFSVLYEAVEALQRMADPHHAEVHHTAATMDEEQPWLLGLVGFLLNCAAAAVFRAHQLEPAPAESRGLGAARPAPRRARDDLLEGVYVLAVAELLARLAVGVGAALAGGRGVVEDGAALAAAAVGGANALPLTHRAALLLLQASPSAAHHRLSRVLIEAGLLDGVIECRDQVTPRESEATCLAGLRSSHRRALCCCGAALLGAHAGAVRWVSGGAAARRRGRAGGAAPSADAVRGVGTARSG